jgi:hypothetical protein
MDSSHYSVMTEDEPYWDLNASKAQPFDKTLPADPCWDESLAVENVQSSDLRLQQVAIFTPADIPER